MWKNIAVPDGPQMKICRKPVACWTTMATNTHWEDAILFCFFTATMIARTRISVTLWYTDWLVFLQEGNDSCVINRSTVIEKDIITWAFYNVKLILHCSGRLYNFLNIMYIYLICNVIIKLLKKYFINYYWNCTLEHLWKEGWKRLYIWELGFPHSLSQILPGFYYILFKVNATMLLRR
jgi:hypothetical protein